MASGTRVENDSERFSQAIRWSLASGAESNEAVNGVQPLHSFEKRERVASPVANTVTQDRGSEESSADSGSKVASEDPLQANIERQLSIAAEWSSTRNQRIDTYKREEELRRQLLEMSEHHAQLVEKRITHLKGRLRPSAIGVPPSTPGVDASEPQGLSSHSNASPVNMSSAHSSMTTAPAPPTPEESKLTTSESSNSAEKPSSSSLRAGSKTHVRRMKNALRATATFEELEDLVANIDTFWNDRSKTAWCPFCKKAISAKTGYEMIRHLTTHLGDRSKFPYKCPLPMCNQRTLRLNCIKKHVATHGVDWTEDMELVSVDTENLNRFRNLILQCTR